MWQRLLVLAAAVTVFGVTAGVVARATDLPWQSMLFPALLAARPAACIAARRMRGAFRGKT
ncbi:hypothetical protein AB0B78_23735 [Streptomyces sp. NPDC040724]|uniref:hypothetical protein n=1 Tax=Streptomyces sp. NPDC040724 TaxID=3155612 RepID=UPI003410E3E2